MRTFLAINIPDRIENQLQATIRRMEDFVPAQAVRWVRPNSAHLTLKFLGEIKPEFIGQIEAVVSPLVQGLKPMNLSVGGVGVFPNLKRPRVLWVGVEDQADSLRSLRNQLQESFEEYGFEAERRRFTPHLTLGRVKRGTSTGTMHQITQSLAEFELGVLGVIKAEALILFESKLSPQGASYRALRTFEFSG